MPAKTPPKFDWPRNYLLSIYAHAVEHGYFLVGPIEQDAAESLRLSLYRLRRRSEAANAQFIRPEYHLVTVGHYRPESKELPIIYTSVPGQNLPGFRVPDVAETKQVSTFPTADVEHHPTPPSPVDDHADEGLSGQALTDYLLGMVNKSIEKGE